jgi:hypothetical protein
MTFVCVVAVWSNVLVCVSVFEYCTRDLHLLVEPVRAHALHSGGHHRGGVNDEQASDDQVGGAEGHRGDTLAHSGVPLPVNLAPSPRGHGALQLQPQPQRLAQSQPVPRQNY